MKFAITGNLDKPGLPETMQGLVRVVEEAHAEYMIDRSLMALLGPDLRRELEPRSFPIEQCIADADIFVAIGGDGTILQAARLVGSRGTPILGVNIGKLGFLAELAPEELAYSIQHILEKKYIVEERIVLRAVIPALPGKVFHAVNDIVLGKSPSSRMIHLETYIDGIFAVTYRGDGLIISTPTGSTAYALSNGGPIVVPTSNVFGITPIAPHTLSGRPLIVPDTARIRVVVKGGAEEVLCSVDGQREDVPGQPAEIIVDKAPYTVRLVKRKDRSYFDVLRAKLFWGQDARSI